MRTRYILDDTFLLRRGVDGSTGWLMADKAHNTFAKQF